MYYPTLGLNQPSVNSQFFLPMSGNMAPNPLNYNYPNAVSNSYLRFKEKQVEPNIQEEYQTNSKMEKEYKKKELLVEELKTKENEEKERNKQNQNEINKLDKYTVLNNKIDENIKELDNLIQLADELSKQKQELINNLK